MSEGHGPLKASFERTYADEGRRADFYRQHRAELAVKIRIGLVALNGGSAVGLATLYGPLTDAGGLADVDPKLLLFVLGAYILGAWMAGWALNSQYVDAINIETAAGTRMSAAGRAADWVGVAGQEASVDEARKTLKNTHPVDPGHDLSAINFHSIAWGLWGTGSLALVLQAAWTAFSRG